MSWEEEKRQFSSHSSQGGAQYNPFHEEDQVEIMEIRKSRLEDSRFYRSPQAGRLAQYAPTIQDDLEDPENIERIEMIEYVERDQRAAGKCRQLCSISTLIILAQIAIFVLMIKKHGFAPHAENPLYGPTAWVLIKYGAKQGGYIIYKQQRWRLITPIFLHAGIIHLATNVYIQYSVGGYLYYMFGPIQWLIIYFSSGIYGNITSSILLTNIVGVGSSGSLMGMLGAWLVFIFYTWRKIPPDQRCHRNCQLFSVLFAITVTVNIHTTLMIFVDWAAHIGGLIQGILLGLSLLAGEIRHLGLRCLVAIPPLLVSVALFAYSLDYLFTRVSPSEDLMEQYEKQEDDTY